MTRASDEFDRIQDEDTIRRFADTIKGLADRNIPVTLVLVGVGDTIDELIADHNSIDRNLVQVFVPRLNSGDIKEIVVSRLEQVGMAIEQRALDYIVRLSQGLPYYAHLIGMSAGLAAVKHNQNRVDFSFLLDGLEVAIENASETIKSSYSRATSSTQQDSLYKQVLLACAMTPVDELGYFTAGDVREPLQRVLGNSVIIQKCLRHLSEFCSEGRGGALEKTGPRWKQRYRFADPLLKPYVFLKGLDGKQVKPEALSEPLAPTEPPPPSSQSPETGPGSA
ncbi:MAG: hypothetical protein EXR51_07995 [Dehalococcoidia bacterium]|nr:hypothetical protein [Dehalococcoidia bacterium]